MRAWVMEKAADRFVTGHPVGSCWAIADAAGNYKHMDEAEAAIPEIQEWAAMHKPDNWDAENDENPFWLGDLGDEEANELREVLLRECALNLREQGYDEG